MILGTLLARLENESDATNAIAALGDIVLFAEIAETGGRFDETPGQYLAGAASRFIAAAQDEEWLGLIAAVEQASDPGKAALTRIVRWALARDRENSAGSCGGGACSCSHAG